MKHFLFYLFTRSKLPSFVRVLIQTLSHRHSLNPSIQTLENPYGCACSNLTQIWPSVRLRGKRPLNPLLKKNGPKSASWRHNLSNASVTYNLSLSTDNKSEDCSSVVGRWLCVVGYQWLCIGFCQSDRCSACYSFRTRPPKFWRKIWAGKNRKPSVYAEGFQKQP